jgi:hypothetical protein
VVRALAVLTAVLSAIFLAACGSARDSAPGNAPLPADLAGDAVSALTEAESAHYTVDLDAQLESALPVAGPFGVHLEGDFSQDVFTADASVTVSGATFTGRTLVGPHELYVEFMGRWFGRTDYGFEDMRAEAERAGGEASKLWRELETGEGVRRYFDQVLVGEVVEGPELDGAATWQFEGTLNPDGIADLLERYAYGGFPAKFRPVLERFAAGTRVTFAVGKDDRLPRRLEVRVQLDRADFEGLEGVTPEDLEEFESLDLELTMTLSEFGKDVSYEAPENFEPFENFGEALFGGVG